MTVSDAEAGKLTVTDFELDGSSEMDDDGDAEKDLVTSSEGDAEVDGALTNDLDNVIESSSTRIGSRQKMVFASPFVPWRLASGRHSRRQGPPF